MTRASCSSPSSLLAVSSLLLLLPSSCANYRHFHLDNADICNSGKLGEESNSLVIGSGAAIIQLQSPSTKFQPDYNKAKRCEIRIKVSQSRLYSNRTPN